MKSTRSKPPILEICVESLAGAMTAKRGGADRIELCSFLSCEGLSPSIGLIQTVVRQVSLPIMVMIRANPRTFVCRPDELEIMCGEIERAKQCGIAGFVFGALTDRGTIDQQACEHVLRVAAPLPVTFHRAFDQVRAPQQSLEIIIELGFQRLLTSGCAKTAFAGRRLIAELVQQAGHRIVVMPGGGICPENAQALRDITQASEFHSSASRSSHLAGEKASSRSTDHVRVTCENTVSSLRTQLSA